MVYMEQNKHSGSENRETIGAYTPAAPTRKAENVRPGLCENGPGLWLEDPQLREDLLEVTVILC